MLDADRPGPVSAPTLLPRIGVRVSVYEWGASAAPGTSLWSRGVPRSPRPVPGLPEIGVAEGHANRMKTLKRAMCDQISFELLRVRILIQP